MKKGVEEERNRLFGHCPECGRNDGFHNVGNAHWFVCHVHGICWCVGSNLFPCWRFEDERDWHPTWEGLRPYKVVNPQYQILTLASPAWISMRRIIEYLRNERGVGRQRDEESRRLEGYVRNIEAWLNPRIPEEIDWWNDSGVREVL